ncbi:MAG: indigoidine synthase A-like protein [Benniella sp.]|nr:MAG: indigoidine synthase A-like protein [Benniella sp.]
MLRIATSPLRKFPSVRLHQQRSTFGSAITSRPSSYLAPLSLSDEVRSALDAKKPLVALESTIISHGMPYPQNFDTAIEVEKIVRDNGATPATIAIIDGQVQIGLSQDQIRHLAKLGRAAVKASRRDMAVVMSKKQTGATTVSATMLLAHRAGISVFATGGIGGVHRGYENTMDASADLTELGRTPVAVVCAGVKSILDIGRTLEFLETQGVTVATFGSTTDFPAFFTRTSGFHSMLNIETPMEAAELIAANHAIDLQSGIVIGVPIPEADAMDDNLVGAAIDTAVKESIEQKIFGKESTPFLLKRVNELTGGNSLKSNIALVKQNASVAARIAKDLSTLNYRPSYQARSYSTNARSSKHYQAGQGPIMVIGGTVVDITATAHEASSMLNSSFPGTARISLGGVGRNVAEGICKLHANGCVFVSAVGGERKHQDSATVAVGGATVAAGDATDDLFGSWLISEIERKGIHQLEIHPIPGARTATYTAIHDSTGNLLSAIADMGVFELLSPSKVREAIIKHQPKTVCFDANLSVESIRAILETCRNQDVQTKCDRPLDDSMMNALLDGALSFASPNEYELQKMALSARRLISDHKGHVHLRGLSDRPVTNALHDPEDVAVMPDENMAYKGLLLDAFSVSQFIPTLFIKLGPKGVLVFQRTRRESPQDISPLRLEDWRHESAVRWQWFPALKVENIKSVTGAGDSFVASVVTNLHNLEKTLSPEASFGNNDPFWGQLGQIIQDGQTAATLTMQTYETVSPSLAQSVQAQRHVLAKA